MRATLRRETPDQSCECGRPAGLDSDRCTGCGAAICPACAAEWPGGTCCACDLADVRDHPPTAAEAAWARELAAQICAAELAAVAVEAA